MAFMNARKRNKTMTYVIIALISIGLLATTLPMGISYISQYTGGNGVSGSAAYNAVQDFNAGAALLGQKGKEAEAQKKLTSAIKGFEEALKTEPNNLQVMGDLATAYFYSGNTDKAIEFGKKALEIEPKYTTVRINLARYYFFGKNDSVEAMKHLDMIQKGELYYEDAQDLKAQIKQSTSLPPQGNSLPPQGGNTLPPQNNNTLPPKQ